MTSNPAATGAAGRFWRRLRNRLQPEPIATAAALKSFLEERAALIAQKCAIDYCRGKTGLASYALFSERTFIEALDVCRWETFVAVLGDLTIMVEGYLRTHAPREFGPTVNCALLRLYTGILDAMPPPAHRPQGWSDATASFGRRLEEASRGEPRRALDVADHSAKHLFDTLPIHLTMRELDEPVVYGAVRFRMIAVGQEMLRRFAAADLARELAA